MTIVSDNLYNYSKCLYPLQSNKLCNQMKNNKYFVRESERNFTKYMRSVGIIPERRSCCLEELKLTG